MKSKQIILASAISLSGLVFLAGCERESDDGAEVPVPGQAAAPAHKHYKCYAIDPPMVQAGGIDVLNQFGREQVPLIRPINFCRSAIKLVGKEGKQEEFGSFDGTDLKCYRINGSDPDRKISLKTAQFGTEVHEVGQAIAACFPANMGFKGENPPQTLTRGPNYVCHLIDGAKPGHGPVDLKTLPFDRETEDKVNLEKAVTIDKPYTVCAPSVRNPEGSPEEQDAERKRIEGIYPHLKCYGIAGPALNKEINIRTIIGLEPRVMVKQPQGLCVAAIKEELGKGDPSGKPGGEPVPEAEAGPDNVQP